MPRAKRGFKARRRRNRVLKWAKGFRALWIQRINAAARALGVSYSKLMGQLSKGGVGLNRKMLAEIAISDPVAFQKIVSA